MSEDPQAHPALAHELGKDLTFLHLFDSSCAGNAYEDAGLPLDAVSPSDAFADVADAVDSPGSSGSDEELPAVFRIPRAPRLRASPEAAGLPNILRWQDRWWTALDAPLLARLYWRDGFLHETTPSHTILVRCAREDAPRIAQRALEGFWTQRVFPIPARAEPARMQERERLARQLGPVGRGLLSASPARVCPSAAVRAFDALLASRTRVEAAIEAARQ